MKPNFALSLSFDGLRLMHRVPGGWHLVGEVALDDADLTGALARLRDAALTLEPDGIATKLLIPNEQIKYLALDTTRAEDGDVRAALDGATPYAVDDLSYDFAKGGGRTYVAAVARETLEEAQDFATEHNFNPVSFAAVPEPFTYVGEAHLGAVDGKEVERDAEPVVVIGHADVQIAPAPPAPADPAVEAPLDTADADAPPPDPTPAPEAPEVTDREPEVEAEVAAPDEAGDAGDAGAPFAEAALDDAALFEDLDLPDVADETGTSAEDIIDAAGDTTPDDADPAETDPNDSVSDTNGGGLSDDTAPTHDAPEDDAPVFASRLRADRNEGRPAPAPASDTPTFGSRRSEPALTRAEPTLAVPIGKGTDPMPKVAAPSRDADAPPVASARVTTQAPAANDAPPITGSAPDALSPEAATAARSLTAEPKVHEASEAETEETQAPARGGAAAAALGAAGAVGGMFASRRMARAEAKAKAEAPTQTDAPDEKSRLTVFGARKKPEPKKVVVGGKPRFLGLILTALLLLFMLAIAAFAALSDEGIARWFGFGGGETQVATAPAENGTTAPEVAVPASSEAPEVAASDALAAPTAPSGGQVLTPEEAQRIYAATGVWQRAPRIPLTPRTTSLDGMTIGSAPRPVTPVPAGPMIDVSSVTGDAVIATPVNPPPPTATFNFGADGLVVATPDGAVTPDGILVIAGAPPLNPPTRPGTVAPEVTPQDQLAALAPDSADTLTDAPEGVIVIAGRPAIAPPVRPGTAPPAPAPEDQALADGSAPLVASDGLLVLAGAPPVLPPVRPGTVAPTALPAPDPALPEADAPPTEITQTQEAPEPPEGLNVIAGSPPVLPPVRPGTVAPPPGTTLSEDVTAALATSTAQAPDADTLRPLNRPASIVQAAAALQNAPVLGGLTRSEALAFRPRTRPAGLAPAPAPEAEPEPEEAAAPTSPSGLQLAPEIAAAVQAANNRPDPIAGATALAVAVSARPDARPRNMSRIVARAQENQERVAAQVAANQPRTVAPSGPTATTVATAATLDNAINLREINLIGIYGGSGDRRALVRLSNGRYVRVTVGDRLDGGRVTAISADRLSYSKRGRTITLDVAG